MQIAENIPQASLQSMSSTKKQKKVILVQEVFEARSKNKNGKVVRCVMAPAERTELAINARGLAGYTSEKRDL